MVESRLSILTRFSQAVGDFQARDTGSKQREYPPERLFPLKIPKAMFHSSIRPDMKT
jgi:hypothetical protein